MTEQERRDICRLLWRWAKVTAYCARKQTEIARYVELIESVSDIRPQQLSDMPRGGLSSDPTPRAAGELIKLKERYGERIAEHNADISEELQFASAMDDALKSLNPNEMRVIELHYSKEKQYQAIARKMGYSVESVKKFHRSAIEKLHPLISVKVL